ncbi:MAG: hypothetical protein BMS9Abin36_0595 [Gammaproteobacteria bacterium]|nr:MAG: hypothetical protein BMS9Abin36_0595 [Gammaproteobacteria bacterium]
MQTGIYGGGVLVTVLLLRPAELAVPVLLLMLLMGRHDVNSGNTAPAISRLRWDRQGYAIQQGTESEFKACILNGYQLSQLFIFVVLTARANGARYNLLIIRGAITREDFRMLTQHLLWRSHLQHNPRTLQGAA